MSMFNYLKTSNDSAFLQQRAGQSNITVDEALEAIALDWRGLAIEGTALADYGTTLDGFSLTYKHVLPGMQGNNIWMVRQLASLRELQGQTDTAQHLRAEATAMAAETIRTMFGTSRDKTRGWWNVIWPAGNTSKLRTNGVADGDRNGDGVVPLQSHEMRHVVDFFSLAFGMCGVSGTDCDLDATRRAQLSNFFHQELKTSDWIRATSPACNCSHTSAVPQKSPAGHALEEEEDDEEEEDEWPGLVTCKANREDHGTTGAYTAWPALATEALCYIEGNCSSAFAVMASFAPNTWQGAFGQANAVPQLQSSPYTPYNDEPAFKPNDRRYLNMAVGAFVDAVVRGFFGYHPPPLWPSTFTQGALDATLLQPGSARGFSGKLRNLRTPFGLATITSGEQGLSIKLQDPKTSEKD